MRKRSAFAFGAFLFTRIATGGCLQIRDQVEFQGILDSTIPAMIGFCLIGSSSGQRRSLRNNVLFSTTLLLLCAFVFSRICVSHMLFLLNSVTESMIWTLIFEHLEIFLVACEKKIGDNKNFLSEDDLDAVERAWIEQIPMLSFAIDTEGYFKYANKYTTNFFKRMSLIGLHIKEFSDNPDLVKVWEEHNRKVLESGQPIHAFEHGKDVSSGNIFCTYVLKFLLTLPNGTSLVAGAGLGADSTEAVIMKLREISDRYELAAESGQIGIWELFWPSLKWHWNSVMPKIYERELGSEGLETWLESIHPEDRERVKRTAEETKSGKSEMKGMEYRIVTPSGKTKYIKAFWVHKYHNGEFSSLLGVNMDITASKEEEKRSLAEKEKALLANQAKSQFLAAMSHEIRTPLNGILGFTQVLKETALSEEQQEFIETISSCGKTLLVILNDILDLSRIESGMLPMEYVNCNVRKLFENNIKLHQTKASGKGLILRLDIVKDVPRYLRLETTRVSQILNNLISNAVKFTEVGEVMVTVSKVIDESDNRLKLSIAVSDSGIGISEEGLKNLFKPFSQAEKSICRRFGGTGLGLAICDRLCKLMHGSLQVKSAPGIGSTFTATISAESGYTLESPLSSTERDEESEYKECCTVLVGEDNLVNQKLFAKIITSAKQKCIIAGTGKEVVDKFASDGPFDMILMDLQMPEMTGIEATKAIRSMEFEKKLKPIPIIAVTADALSTTRKECIDAGMNGYLTKPIQVSEVKKCISKYAADFPCP